jgi:predicted DCC family thiol-disulfide oxidoreductase YuxK
MQLNNRWTCGQFSVFRVVLGVYLLQHFLALLPWGKEIFSSAGVLHDANLSPLLHLFPNIFLISSSPLFVELCLAAGAVFSLFFIISKFDRISAVLIWYLWACLYGRNPLIGNPSLPFLGWLLLAYALIPAHSSKATFARSGDQTPDWALPGDIFLAAWVLMSAAYLYSGYTKLVSPSWIDGSALNRVLANPLARDTVLRVFLLGLPPLFLKMATWSALALELSFAPLALFRRIRPLIWLAMVGLHLGLVFLVNFADLTLGMLIVHFFAFDPGWIRSPQPAGEHIFFDGHCGLCHGFVRFVLIEDQSEQPFSFAPLQGESARHMISKNTRSQLPDSLIVIDAKNALLTQSVAVVYVMKRLGGIWFLAASLLSIVPRALRDFAYATCALLRKSLFGTTQELCPLVPAQWRARFRD